MAVVTRTGMPFDLKSTALSGLALMLRTTDLPSLAAAMAERFGTVPGVFSHDPVVIDLSGLDDDSAADLDFPLLIGLLRGHHLLAAGVRGGGDRLLQAAANAGLSDVADDPTSGASSPRTDAPGHKTAEAPSTATVAAVPPAVTATVAPGPDAAQGAVSAAASGTAAVEPSPVATALTAATLIIDKPLRSGQQVYAKGGDLVVLATVNVGAEVIADGSIHVYGPLRGKAVAGAKGRLDARIFSTCMEPQLLAIAGTYRTTETPLPADVVGKPAQIRLDGERLVFEPLA